MVSVSKIGMPGYKFGMLKAIEAIPVRLMGKFTRGDATFYPIAFTPCLLYTSDAADE